MNYTFTPHIGDGSTKVFSFSLAGQDNGYVQRSDINVFVGGVAVPFTLSLQTPNQVTITTAPAVGSEVLIRRIVPKTNTYTDFQSGNPFTADNLNKSFLQGLYLQQEWLDGFLPTGFYLKQNVDVGGHKFVNMAEGTESGDSVNWDQWYDHEVRIEGLEGDLTGVTSRTIPYYYIATGGETRWSPAGRTFDSAIMFINGVFQNQNLGAFNISSNGFNFAEPLVKGDEVYALIGSTPATGGMTNDQDIEVIQPYAGAIKSNQHDKNARYIDVADFGVVGNGLVDDTVAIINAANASYLANLPLYVGGANILISSDVTFYRELISDGSAIIRAADNLGDVPPTISVYFARKQNLNNLTFNFVHVRVRPSSTPIISTTTEVKLCSFVNAPLWVGQDEAITSGYNIHSNRFAYQNSREHSSITLTNANHVVIENNQSQDSKSFVLIQPTRSFAAQNIRIEHNRASSFSDCAVRGSGTSMFRLSKLTIKNNTFSQGVRDTELLSKGTVQLTYVTDLEIDGNSMSGRNDQISLTAVLTGRILNNTLHVGGTQIGLRARACSHMLLAHNVIQCQTTAFAALIGAANLNPVIANVVHPSKEWVIRDNTINLLGNGLKIENTDGAQIYNNTFTSTGASPVNGQLFFGGGMTRAYHYGNQHIAASGTPVGNQSGTNVLNSMPDATLKVQAVTPVSVSAPTITNSDPDMSGAKSYVFTFTLGHYTQLRHLANQYSDRKTLSQWMATVSGATLGWNASAWRVDRSLLPDIVANGVMTDTFSTEYYGTFRSLMVIDQLNRLTCRNFMGSYADSVPLMIGAASISEKAWQTANFRSPLVVDGAIYSPVPTGLLSEAGWSSDLSGRMALGQRADGTFILVCCDGTSGSSGSTMLQVAQKMLAMGALNAFNLDGGGSTTLWYNGAIINSPSDAGGERAVPSVMYV